MNITDFSPKVFELFNKHWALLTAGEGERANPMTISWGSLGTIWGRKTGMERMTRIAFTSAK